MIDEYCKDLPNLYKVLCQIDADFNNFEGEYDIHRALNDLKILGSGSSRDTFAINDNYVLKVPNTKYGAGCGLQANMVEFLIYRRFKKLLPLAPCKLYFYGKLPVLVMKRLHRPNGYNTIPELSGFCDGYSQVGKTKSGKWLCYDYGYELLYAIGKMEIKTLDLTPSEIKRIISRKPQLSKCPLMGVIIPEYKALLV